MSTTPNFDPHSMSRAELMCFMRSNYSSNLDEDDFSILEKLKFNGETLLDGKITSAELMSVGMAMGPAKYLTLKIQELRSRNPKRTSDQADLALPGPLSSKVPKHNIVHIDKGYRILWDKIHHTLGGDDKDYSNPVIYANPENLLKLPFPNNYEDHPYDRFKLDRNHCFDYMGRSKFLDIYQAVVSMEENKKNRTYSLQGILGYGKSFMMAALTILLMRLGKRVVYFPHCRTMAKDLRGYVQSAFLLAYADKYDTQQRIASFGSLNDVYEFCNDVRGEGEVLYFLVDQLNALDTNLETVTSVHVNKRVEALDFIQMIQGRHYYVWSASGNYEHAEHDMYRQIGEERIILAAGLSQDEMDRWWLHFKDRIPVALRDEDRKALEAYTGRIPILLRALLDIDLGFAKSAVSSDESSDARYKREVSRILDLFFTSIEVTNLIKSIQSFARNQQKMGQQNQLSWKWYKESSYGCLTNSTVVNGAVGIVDSRYFYETQGTGRATSLIAQKALASFLRSAFSHSDFLTPQWYHSVVQAGDNPSVLGFFIEQMLLSWVSCHGCHKAGPEFYGKEIPVQMFSDFPNHLPDPVVLYVPMSYNFRAIDGILVHRDNASKAATIVPIQITISKPHSDSEEKFYGQWREWTALFEDWTIETRFLWIKETIRPNDVSGNVDATFPPATRQNLHPQPSRPAYSRIFTTVAEISPPIGEKLKQARQPTLIPAIESRRASLTSLLGS
ncbi:hypothetical protein BDD12DRAFT_841601 [Trichophaea hybrida]|nr:hypothetical protein BDD12DRAFT_841601 [Trichophaea hybrida]